MGETAESKHSRPSSSKRSYLSRKFARKVQDAADGSKGPLGLHCVYSPKDAIVDLIFVHGLNGGSYSTWRNGSHQENFWPQKWLPQDEAFSDVRIHTFGYASSWGTESVLNIHDFAMSLLAAIEDSPEMGYDSQAPTRFIFIAHSMGGLVVKEAFIIGHRDPQFKHIVDRVSTILFLATPHRGASLAQTLARLGTILPGQRPFVGSLVPRSERLQFINEEFPRLCGDLKLVSFFETRPMNFITNLIVDKESAVMNVPNERRTLLNANHRNVAKYTSTNDPTYITVRNTLAKLVSPHRNPTRGWKNGLNQEDTRVLSTLLSLTGEPDDIIMQDQQRLPGTCRWLSGIEAYRSWREARNSTSLWICGRPGAGKSFLSGHTVKELRDQGADTCFFFFQSADATKATANACLRSLAWQMAAMHPQVYASIKNVAAGLDDDRIDTVNPNPVWRRLYLSGILQARINKPQFWVIDAMDECKESIDMMSFLSRIQEYWPVSVLITCRDPVDRHRGNMITLPDIESYTIEDKDNEQDIAMFVESQLHRLPEFHTVEWPSQSDMASHIIDRSGGCFLWASLICSSLQKVASEKEAKAVMESVPSNMDALYSRIFNDMSASSLGKDCARAVIIWTAYALRPLTTTEMKEPIEIDLQGSIILVADTIKRSCGQIVYVDSQEKVRFVHSTVKEYITAETTRSEFAVTKTEGHRHLALVCLEYLIGKSKVAPRARRFSSNQQADGEGTSRRRPFISSTGSNHLSYAFKEYANTFLFSHLNHVHSNDDEVLAKLVQFLSSHSVLHWIEFSAEHGNLRTVYQAGKTIISMMARRAQQPPPTSLASRPFSILEKWGDDLVHLATRFARRLKDNPQAIHHLIPPFCPPSSVIRQQFAKLNRVSVHGISAREWDDCLTTITYDPGAKPNAIAAGSGLFAVGMMTPAGKVIVYDEVIFQEVHVLMHGEPVFRLALSKNGDLLVSAGSRSVRIWTLKDGKPLQHIHISSLCLALGFAEDDSILWVATKQNQIYEWDVTKGCLIDVSTWTKDLKDSMQSRTPTMTSFLFPKNVLCVIYRGEKLLLWDFKLGEIYDIYGKESAVSLSEDRAIDARAISLSYTDTNGSRIAVTYADGDLVLHDMDEGKPTRVARRMNAMALASSPDGRTLAGVDSEGNFTLFELETLQVLYRVRFTTQMLPKCMTFSADSERFIEISGNQCRVWEPIVLLRPDASEINSDTLSVSSGPQEIEFQPNFGVSITAMVCCRSASVVFCAMEDGSVHVYDISVEPRGEKLFTQTTACTIHLLYLDEMDEGSPMILASGDESGRTMVWPVSRRSPHSQTGWTVSAEPLIDAKASALGVLRQVLVSRNHDMLLTCTDQYNTLWPVPKQGEGIWVAQEMGVSSHPSWLQHPLKPELLICVSASQFRVCRWSDLSVVRSIDITLNGTFHQLAPLHQKYFATVSECKSPSSTSQTKRPCFIQLWDFNGLEGSVNRMEPVCEIDGTGTNADFVIGAFESRLVLSSDDYWISSVKLGISMADLPCTRHFFVPDDWANAYFKLVMGIGSNGEILVAKQSELIVIKGGLKTTEQGKAFFPPRGNNMEVLHTRGKSLGGAMNLLS